MTDEEITSAPEKLSLSLIDEQVLARHAEFDKNWGKESYHNQNHVETVMKAVDLYVDRTDRENDPAGFWKSLDEFNADSDIKLSDADAKEAAHAFALFHEIGMIADSAEMVDGKLVAKIFDRFKANDHEVKSAKIAGKVLGSVDGFGTEKGRRKIELVQMMIKKTEMESVATDTNFGVFAQVCDQVGGHILSSNNTLALGLAREWVEDRPDRALNPHRFFGLFPKHQLEKFIPDTGNRDKLLNIWEKTESDLVTNDLPDRKMTLHEFVTGHASEPIISPN